ncbi:hypothetical protein [Dyadobacter luteus]|nr:hypothetical protein [Dyadobacter luteus]
MKHKSRVRALTPDPNQSLFKFKLSFSPSGGHNAISTQTWYSFDYIHEREVFPAGLSKQMRDYWKHLLASCWKSTDLYETLKWLRPHSQQHILELYLPNWPGFTDKLKLIENTIGWTELETAVKHSGYEDFCFKLVGSKHPRQPSNSPGRNDFTAYYGFQYLQRNNYILENLHNGKLIKIDIYDNLMYHSENHLYTFTKPA